jgi:predicted N-acyltransferase
MGNFELIKDPERWQELLDQTKFSTAFHTPEWAEIVSNNYPWLKPRFFLYSDSSENQAIIPFFEYYSFRGKKMTSIPFCEYGGPLPLDKLINFSDFCFDINNYSSKEKYSGLKIKFHPSMNNWIPESAINNSECKISSNLHTCIMNLNNSIDEYLSSLKKDTRYSIKKSQKEGVKIHIGKNENDFKKFYSIYINTMKKYGSFSMSYGFFQALATIKPNKNNSINMKLFLATINTKIIGGIVLIEHRDTIHYYLSGTRPGFSYYQPNSILLYEAIKSATDDCYRFFDFGATEKNSPIQKFKSQWCQDDIKIFQLNIGNINTYHESPIRKVWSKMPSSIISAISPYLLRCIDL